MQETDAEEVERIERGAQKEFEANAKKGQMSPWYSNETLIPLNVKKKSGASTMRKHLSTITLKKWQTFIAVSLACVVEPQLIKPHYRWSLGMLTWGDDSGFNPLSATDSSY